MPALQPAVYLAPGGAPLRQKAVDVVLCTISQCVQEIYSLSACRGRHWQAPCQMCKASLCQGLRLGT